MQNTLIGFSLTWHPKTVFVREPHIYTVILYAWERARAGVYIKLCSHEVAKHKSGVICRFHLMVPALATTLRKMVTQSVRMGNAHAWSLRTRRRQYTNPMSKLVSPKTFQSNKSAKNYDHLCTSKSNHLYVLHNVKNTWVSGILGFWRI
jgi:hypothetical protein